MKDRSFAELFEQSDMSNFEIKEKLKAEKEMDKSLKNNFSYPQNYQDKLDLHGFKAEEAIIELEKFINDKRAIGLKMVLIITGKGIHSPGAKAKLRPVVIGALNRLIAEKRIKDYRNAKNKDGGMGAIKVFLK